MSRPLVSPPRPDCPACRGAGVAPIRVRGAHPDFRFAGPCDCTLGGLRERRRRDGPPLTVSAAAAEGSAVA